MSATDQPSEEELRAAYEAEIKRISVEQVLLEQIVTLINLGMRRTGLQPGTEDERDPPQVRLAIEAVRALLPFAEQAAGPQAAPHPRGAVSDAAGLRPARRRRRTAAAGPTVCRRRTPTTPRSRGPHAAGAPAARV